MSQIPLNSDGGIEPHMCFCPRCGEDTNELTLGVLKKAQANDGSWVYCNRGQSHKVNYERMKAGLDTLTKWKPVEKTEKVPGTLCEKCQNELGEHHKIVSDGGVFFTCDECHCTGVIKKCEFANHVRKQLGVEIPKACGIRFKHCMEHEDE